MTHCIEIQDLSKRYRIGSLRHDLMLRERLVEFVKHPFGFRREEPQTIWALRDVSFRVEDGEVIGIIGRNGAGKSTLLKILSKITYPTSGRMKVKGRVASLLEVGTGFHDELTGRENVYLNGSILGMKKREVEQRFDAIVAFAGVEQFIDTPVKRYSSGMRLRLGFAVAAHLDPDILIVDEVLAVGDVTFQRKCLSKMGTTVQEGRTVLLVSHNMAAISSLCTRTLLIDNGRLEYSGPTQSVIEEYLSRSQARSDRALSAREDRKGDGRIRFTNISVLNDRHEMVETVTSGQDISLAFEYEIRDSEMLDNAIVQIKFFGVLGQPLFACLSRASLCDPLVLSSGTRLFCNIPRLPLVPGIYTYTIWCTVGGILEDFVSEAGKLSVVEGDYFGTGKLPPNTVGDFLVAHTWSIG